MNYVMVFRVVKLKINHINMIHLIILLFLNISNKLCVSNIEYNMGFFSDICKKITEEASIEEISNIIIE